MRRQYASSVYSQKSTTSAKSGRSFLSLTTPIWPYNNKNNNNVTKTTPISTANDITLNEAKQGVWQNLKNWIPNSPIPSKKKKNDSDSIATRSSASSSVSRLKQLFNGKKKYSPSREIEDSSPRLSLDTLDINNDAEEESSSSEKPSPLSATKPIGILINRGEDSAEAIAERKKRRHQRREEIRKLQKHNRSLHHHPCFQEAKNHQPIESSSSDTLLTDDNNLNIEDYNKPSSRKMVVFQNTNDGVDENGGTIDDDCWGYNPRIMFVEPSPVPRFRNVAPAPPPSPPLLNIIVHSQELMDNASNNMHNIIKSPTTDEDEPTVFASRDNILSFQNNNNDQDEFMMNHEKQMSLLIETLKSPPQKPRIYFNPPFRRGQTLNFSLKNMIPDDHIILFKFLTSNASPNIKGQPERYFVRPSAGKMVSTDQTEIMLFLNQVPFMNGENRVKDKIMIRWAAIQRNTNIETWVNSLQESTRRKWIDMLDEEWPDQVTIRMTRIKIRFNV
ncbi:hypothetical protein INT46_001836 [Mucor plumbeus]|uniref:MSP domain-containing protein n=1 Tax=Mucor plumbeus TaxID=97098 RepID=A0A8H7QUS3_9FUNG|nr:hypothetical protein INT46_001836 [Mucor plumbeus]